jgi:hypothetical protein
MILPYLPKNLPQLTPVQQVFTLFSKKLTSVDPSSAGFYLIYRKTYLSRHHFSRFLPYFSKNLPQLTPLQQVFTIFTEKLTSVGIVKTYLLAFALKNKRGRMNTSSPTD